MEKLFILHRLINKWKKIVTASIRSLSHTVKRNIVIFSCSGTLYEHFTRERTRFSCADDRIGSSFLKCLVKCDFDNCMPPFISTRFHSCVKTDDLFNSSIENINNVIWISASNSFWPVHLNVQLRISLLQFKIDYNTKICIIKY